jgi:hypothetical protein
MIRDFMEAGLIGNYCIDQTMYIPHMIRYDSKKDINSECERYKTMFPTLDKLMKEK